MDLPATQAIDDEDVAPTQQFPVDDNNENTVVGTLQIDRKSHLILSGITTIGRHPASKIVINDETVSKNHAEIEAESTDASIFIKDLDSCNKTKINDTKLRPKTSYQIKDGDKLTFGKVEATFKLYNPVDDSFISCTPQVNRKVPPIIPGTPDSSMNTSSASESDVSAIPGTQTDEIDRCFRRPQIPVKTSTSNEHRSPKLPAFTSDDLPDSDENIYELETQRPFNSDEDKSNIENLQTQKFDYKPDFNKEQTIDEFIYNAETQKNISEDADCIENFETQQFDKRKPDFGNRKSNDVSIYTAETQKNIPEDTVSIDNLETQQFDTRKSNDLSIYSAATQKNISQEAESIENLETQQFNTRKSNDVSIYSAPTQKNIPKDSECIENLETQQFDTRKSNDVSIYSAPTQKNIPKDSESIENLETQQFDTRKSNDVSIYSAVTQKKILEDSESTENLETQQFDGKSDFSKRKSNVSIYNAETQKIVPDAPVNESMEDLETQVVDIKKFNFDKKKSNDTSVYNAETQKCVYDVEIDKSIQIFNIKEIKQFECGKFNVSKVKINSEPLHDVKPQEMIPDKTGSECLQTSISEKRKSTNKMVQEDVINKSLNDLETQQFIIKKSNIVIDESIEDVESQQLVDQNSAIISTLSISVEDMETMPFVEEKLPSFKIPEELSFDSGFRTIDQDNGHNKTKEQLLSSSSEKINQSKITSDAHEMSTLNNDEPQNNHSKPNESLHPAHLSKIDVSTNLSNVEQTKSVAEEDDEEDMFCSQNLIEDCPIAFLPQESQTNEIQSDAGSGKSVKSEMQKNQSSNDEALNISADISKTKKENKEDLAKENNSDTAINDDSETDDEGIFSNDTAKAADNKTFSNKEAESETDEEGVFSGHASKEDDSSKTNNEDTIKKLISKNNAGDFETDEEGVFSTNLSKQDDNSKTNNKNNKKNKNLCHKDGQSNSETDEEGVFSSHLSKENENNKVNNKSKQNNTNLRDNDGDDNSETDEEGIFSCRLSKEDISTKLNNENNKNICDKDNQRNPENDKDVSSSSVSLENENKTSSNKNNDAKQILTSDVINKNDSEQSSEIYQKIPDSDSGDNLFDGNKKRTCLQRSVETNNIAQDDTSSKTEDLFSTLTRNMNKVVCSIEDDELAPRRIVQTETFNSEDFSLAVTQIVDSNQLSDEEKNKTEKVDDVASTNIQDDSEDEFLAPTQIANPRTSPVTNSERERDFLIPVQSIQNDDLELAPTQKIDTQQCTIMSTEDSPNQKTDEEFYDLNLAPTQKMVDTQQCSDSLSSTQLHNEQEKKLEVQVTKNATNKNSDCEIGLSKAKSQMRKSLSKRQLEEVEITSNKKIKTGDSQSIKIDINSIVEKNLNDIFDGPEEKSMEENSSLLTQQLANILESSQDEDSLKANTSTSVPSPTLVTRRSNSITKNRRKAMLLQRKGGSPYRASKLSINLDDTVERNLNQLFNDSINNVDAYESDSMMTQQLKNVLQSQDDSQSEIDETNEKIESRSSSMNGKKKHRLSLSVNLNTSFASKNKNAKEISESCIVQSTSNLDKKKLTSQESNLNEESQNTNDYFANLKSKKKRNVIEDSQSEDDSMDRQLSSGSEQEIVYKRGILGFSNDNKPVSTKERVKFLEPKGRSFTSDSQSSQSDTENLFNDSLNISKASGKKRLSLSLHRINVNSFQLSATVQGTERRISSGPKKFVASLSPRNTGNNKAKSTSTNLKDSTTLPTKRVRARSTRGFSSGDFNSQVVEGDELVSAASTGDEDDELPDATAKVCKSNYSYVDVDSKDLTTKVASSQASSVKAANDDENTDSDEDFLKSMPAIKVAGTVDCPPTNSQLAAASDHEDLESVSSEEFAMPAKWNWYANKRYDLIYKKEKAAKAPTEKSKDGNNSDEVSGHSLAIKKDEAQTLSVDEIIKKIESAKPRKNKRFSKHDVNKTKSDSDSDAKSMDDTKLSTRSTRTRRMQSIRNSSSLLLENSPKLDLMVERINSQSSFIKTDESNNSDSDSMSIIPKYKPLEPIKFNLAAGAKLKDDDDDDSDQEFEALRKKCEIMLAGPSAYKNLAVQSVKKVEEKASPVKSQQKKKSALSNCNSLNITRSNGIEKQKPKTRARTVDKDALVFQVSSDSSKKPTTSRMSGLTIIPNKRSVGSDVDDTQNKPPKRTKTDDDGQIKFQEVSPAVIKSSPEKKRLVKVPRTLDSYVLQQKPKGRTNSPDLSSVENSIIEEKNESNKAGTRTRGKAAANNKKAKDNSLSIVRSNSLNKDRVVVEDSDVESDNVNIKTRSGRVQRKQITDSSVLAKDSSKKEISSSGTENESTKPKRGRPTRQNQKKDKPVNDNKLKKESSVIQDSDLEQSDESKINVNKRIRKKQTKVVKIFESDQSDKSEITVNIGTRSKRVKSTKDLESKKPEKIEAVINIKATRGRQKKIRDQSSDIVFSESNNDNDKKKNTSAANKSKNSRPVRQTRKTAGTDVSSSEKSQESKILKNSLPESNDNSQKGNVSDSNKSINSRSVRQTRKRTATDASVIEPSSSEESQEVAEIMKNSILKDTESKSGARRGRSTRKGNLTSSEDSQDSEGKKSNADNVFEKPVSRPKRARLNKSIKNKSAFQHNSDDDKHSQELVSSSRKKKSPSPIPSSTSVHLTPSRIRSSISMSPMKGSSYKVLFTGEKSEVHRQIVKKLGGSEIEDLAKCSILVTDKVRRTFKFLCSLARGIPIVSVKWLDDSNKVHHFLDWEDYILKDSDAEAKFKFNLKESLEKAKKHKLLEGYSVLLTPNIMQPPISELKEMVISSGGKPLLRAPTKWPEKTVIIAEDLQNVKKFIAKAPKSVTIQSKEFILTGILRQDVNLQEFKLSV